MIPQRRDYINIRCQRPRVPLVDVSAMVESVEKSPPSFGRRQRFEPPPPPWRAYERSDRLFLVWMHFALPNKLLYTFHLYIVIEAEAVVKQNPRRFFHDIGDE